MNVGMLWLDDDRQRSLDEKVNRAAEYYQEKYGRSPELCLVNQKSLSEKKTVGHIEVQPAQTVLPHHFWLGMKS
ncbi:MAG: hypothetical protein H6659_00215 [Ardenticatenaceae bacterium]|nr:hypothetical protein [Anaerolineales bacterium]MCB8982230.1 hypothetical protein [Ardenticatenaceae bacterium]MCB8987020.1 hypothetical protein [Ardenticatenaceae bacterium]